LGAALLIRGPAWLISGRGRFRLDELSWQSKFAGASPSVIPTVGVSG
jgi:hypothetical protein